MSAAKPAGVSDLFYSYVQQQNPVFYKTLTELYLLIKSTAPEAAETFSYQVHCFKYLYMLVGIGVNKDFCSLHTMSSTLIKQMKSELTGLKLSGMTVHFKPGEPLPVEQIVKMVLGRKMENEVKAMQKRKRT